MSECDKMTLSCKLNCQTIFYSADKHLNVFYSVFYGRVKDRMSRNEDSKVFLMLTNRLNQRCFREVGSLENHLLYFIFCQQQVLSLLIPVGEVMTVVIAL